MTAGRWIAWMACVAAVAACGDAESVNVIACVTNSQCPSGWHCGPLAVCSADVPCGDDSQCCYGERCEGGHCRARQACSAGAGCMDPADTCLLGMCVARACTLPEGVSASDAAVCGKGRQCLWGRCFGEVPCTGRCGPNQACAVLISRCVAAPLANCTPGQLPVIANEVERMPQGCGAIAPQIACRQLPPLLPGERGLPGQLLQVPGQIVHVSYDRSYGDLMLARHNASPPFALKSLHVLSGLATLAPIVGAVDGPRGGVADPGPDHGRRLASVADSAGRIKVAYRDDSGDALRFGEVQPDGSVATHQVAAGAGIGEQVAITLSAAGLPVVVAFAPEATQPARAARLQVFSAKVASPSAAGDWTVVELDSEAVQAPQAPCGGACPAGQACIAVAGKAACQATAATCTTCLPGQACIAGSCTAALVGLPVLDWGPTGRGAAIDILTLQAGSLVAAAYSAHSGDLALYRLVSGTWQKSVVPKASVPGGSANFGRFVHLVEGDAGKVWAACEDADRGRLLVVRQADKGFGVEVADDGARSDGLHRVGADTTLIRHPFGGLLLAHQDTRRSELLLQRVPKPGTIGARAILETAAMAGFSPTIVQLGTKAFVVASTTLRLDPDGRLRSSVQFRDLVWTGD